MNKVMLHGMIPFELEPKNFEDEEKKSYLGFFLNVQRDYTDSSGKRPSDDIYIKAFGPTAEFIHRNFGQKSHIIIEGRLYREEDTEDDEGNRIRGRMHVIADRVYFSGGPNNGNGNGENTQKSTSKKNGNGNGQKKETINPLRGAKKKTGKKSLMK